MRGIFFSRSWFIYRLTSIIFSQVGFGVTMAGEFSTGFNDCGLFLRGVPGSHTYGGNCGLWQDSTNWTAGTKAGLMNLALAQMDALQNWFFWTWKVCYILSVYLSDLTSFKIS